ncbi:hypothetical protein BJF78_25895 [Pseudonocardia sp. CNS-139]|nr:hypothetical protein BJF78_25895 [Pseudonocardia sp. CNS-139]
MGESLAGRALTPAAERLARASALAGGGSDHQVWMALHAATNPDPLAAAVDALERARWALGPYAADFLDTARRRLSGG